MAEACAMAFDDPMCEGRLDPHHIIHQQTLRAHGRGDTLDDERNILALCRRHHARHHSGLQRIPREIFKPAVFEFATEVGLEWYLDRHYPPTGGKEEQHDEVQAPE